MLKFDPNAASVKMHGPALLCMPLSLVLAQTQGEQVVEFKKFFANDPARLAKNLNKFFGL